MQVSCLCATSKVSPSIGFCSQSPALAGLVSQPSQIFYSQLFSSLVLSSGGLLVRRVLPSIVQISTENSMEKERAPPDFLVFPSIVVCHLLFSPQSGLFARPGHARPG